jgi:hypothetical protein
LKHGQINDAVELLHNSGLVEWLTALGTAPYDFALVRISALGKYEVQRRKSLEEAIAVTLPDIARSQDRMVDQQAQYLVDTRIIKPPVPIGSPYGFTAPDWELVSTRKANKNVLYVVLGCKFKSSHYNTKKLRKNVKKMCELAVHSYNKKNPGQSITLEFVSLHAGYGGHLFNAIARDIISSDIAVFETSDLAPNVFIEVGVALTWGSRVFLIKKQGCPSPPTDISGHTFAEFLDNARIFVDPQHDEKLYRMVEHAIRTKG